MRIEWLKKGQRAIIWNDAKGCYEQVQIAKVNKGTVKLSIGANLPVRRIIAVEADPKFSQDML